MRPPRLPPVLAPLALVALLTGCQSPDVGQRCPIPLEASPPGALTPATVSGDYLETGNTFCDNLVCILSPAVPGGRYNECSGDACGYCSKACVSDSDCFRSQTGLACRQVVLDPAFIAALEQSNPALLNSYLADIRFSSYCAVPR